MRVPRIITDVTEEPITLAEARAHLRVDTYGSPAESDEDLLIAVLITAAREWLERTTGRTIAVKTLELRLDQFPAAGGVIELQGAPVQQVIGFDYAIDGQVLPEALSDYQLDTESAPARLAPLAGATTWPSAATGQLNAVRVRYIAGYDLIPGSPSFEVLPKVLKQAMLLCIGHWYENREDASVVKLESIPMGSQAIAQRYKINQDFA